MRSVKSEAKPDACDMQQTVTSRETCPLGLFGTFGTARSREGGARAALRCSAFSLRLGWAGFALTLLSSFRALEPGGALRELKQHGKAKGLGPLNLDIRKSESAEVYKTIRPGNPPPSGCHGPVGAAPGRRQVPM